MDKREFERRHVNAHCVIRYVSLDGRSVERIVGTMRDLSRSGIGILAKVSLRRNTPVHLCVTCREGKSTNFTGNVIHAQPADEGRYLLGVKFCKIDDERVAYMLDPSRAHDTATGSDGMGTTSVKVPEEHKEVGEVQ